MKVKDVQYQIINTGSLFSPFNAYLQLSGHLTLLLIYPPAPPGYKTEDHPIHPNPWTQRPILIAQESKKGNEKVKADNTITQNEPATETDLI